MGMHQSAFFVVLSLVASAASGQVCAEYDASLGTLPDAQGWERRDILTGGPVSASVDQGVLVQSTLPFTNIECPNTDPDNLRNLFWQIRDIPFDIEDGIAFESTLRVATAQGSPCVCEKSAMRAGFYMLVRDDLGRRFEVGFFTNQVVLNNDGLANCESPSTIFVPVDTTSAFRTYRLEIDGPHAVLLIDGQPVAEHTNYGPIRNPDLRSVLIGDITSWSNSSFEIRSFSVSQPACVCPADLAEPFGLLDLADVNAFTQAFVAGDPLADLDGNGLFDLSDVNLFVASFLAGCP